jgi:hypothetical protein
MIVQGPWSSGCYPSQLFLSCALRLAKLEPDRAFIMDSAALAIAVITSSGYDDNNDKAKKCFGDKSTDDPNNADAECARKGELPRQLNARKGMRY